MNTLGMKFVPVPITGGPTDGKRVLFSVWETRVQDYEVFAKETRREWPKPGFEQGPTHPAVNVSWDDAQAFCMWLTERERKAGKIAANERYHLPSDHEWSCAAGIGGREDAAKLPIEKNQKIPDVFPWGVQWPPPIGAGNYKGEEWASGASVDTQLLLKGYRDGYSATAPVATYPANQFGLFDLGGNVWEWCADWFDLRKDTHVQRGGGFFFSSHDFLLSSYRGYTKSGYNYNSGFRVVLARSPGKGDGVVGMERITSVTATQAAPFINSLGMKFVPVPITGGPTDGKRVLFSVWETRVQDYEVFVNETGHEPAKPSFSQGPAHPAVNVSWVDAQAFCAWLSDRERKTGQLDSASSYRLPSDHEWSCAVGIGDREDPLVSPKDKDARIDDIYPWGSHWPPHQGAGNFAGSEVVGQEVFKIQKPIPRYSDAFPHTSPVGTFTANDHGIFDLGGNVREWCDEWYDEERRLRVSRGVSFAHGSQARDVSFLSSARHYGLLTLRGESYGFRIVLAGSGPSQAEAVKAAGIEKH